MRLRITPRIGGAAHSAPARSARSARASRPVPDPSGQISRIGPAAQMRRQVGLALGGGGPPPGGAHNPARPGWVSAQLPHQLLQPAQLAARARDPRERIRWHGASKQVMAKRFQAGSRQVQVSGVELVEQGQQQFRSGQAG